jgi:hypothetical protein
MPNALRITVLLSILNAKPARGAKSRVVSDSNRRMIYEFAMDTIENVEITV